MTDCSLISHSLEGHMFSSLKKSFTIVVEWKATSSIGQLCRRRHHSFGLTSENGAYVGAVIRRHSSLLKVTWSKFNDKPKFLRWKPKEGCLTDIAGEDMANIGGDDYISYLHGGHVDDMWRKRVVGHMSAINVGRTSLWVFAFGWLHTYLSIYLNVS